MLRELISRRCKKLRKEATIPETIVWGALRNRSLSGIKFRRQHPVGNYILDFYCEQKHLAIEIDGETHLTPEQKRYDEKRTAFLNKVGIKVVRFTNEQVQLRFNDVLEEITRNVNE